MDYKKNFEEIVFFRGPFRLEVDCYLINHPCISSITNIIFNYEKSEDFDIYATKLQQQAQKNIDITKKLIAQKITHKNHTDALLSFINRNGRLILLGSPAVVFMETEHFLDYLHQFAPNVAHAEDVLHQKIHDAGIDFCWISAVSKYIISDFFNCCRYFNFL